MMMMMMMMMIDDYNDDVVRPLLLCRVYPDHHRRVQHAARHQVRGVPQHDGARGDLLRQHPARAARAGAGGGGAGQPLHQGRGSPQVSLL